MHTAAPSVTAHNRQPEFLQVLGLSFPCDKADVQHAYRQKVWQAHPDRGGDMQNFLALQQAYERAMEYVSFQSGRSHWLSKSLERYVDLQAVISEVELAGGKVELESLDWFSQEFGADFGQVLERIVGLQLTSPQFDDAAVTGLLARESVRTHLHRLNLSGSSITNRALLSLGQLGTLHELDLSGTNISNRALSAVNGMPELERIDISGTRVNILGRLALAWSRPYLLVRHVGANFWPAAKLLRWLMGIVLFLYLSLMFAATHVRFRDVEVDPHELAIDKLVHFSMYLGLGFLAGGAIGLTRRVARLGTIGTSLATLALLLVLGTWAFLDELTQPMFGRTFDWYDWVADLVGILSGVAAFRILLRLVRRRLPTVWVMSKAQHDVAKHRRVLRETIEGLAVHSI